jgi:hypothetical protein
MCILLPKSGLRVVFSSNHIVHFGLGSSLGIIKTLNPPPNKEETHKLAYPLVWSCVASWLLDPEIADMVSRRHTLVPRLVRHRLIIFEIASANLA